MKLLITVTNSVKCDIETDWRLVKRLKLHKVKIKPISITDKWLIGIKLSFSNFSIFIDTDPPTWTLKQILGRSGDANQTYLWASPKQLHHSIGLSDRKTVIVYYSLELLQMFKLLWFGIAGTGCTKNLRQWLFTSLTYLICHIVKKPSICHKVILSKP